MFWLAIPADMISFGSVSFPWCVLGCSRYCGRREYSYPSLSVCFVRCGNPILLVYYLNRYCCFEGKSVRCPHVDGKGVGIRHDLVA